MAAAMEKTKTPGIFRRGGRYVVVYRDHEGRQRKESARTYDEARKLKAARTADVARGEFAAISRDRFGEYALEWVERYQGTGRRGFRESTREDYRARLTAFAVPYFDGKLRRKLSEVTPADVAGFIAWLCDEDAQGKRLAESTIGAILTPVRSVFATAVREGKVRHNPCNGAALPHREEIVDEDGQDVRALSREQLAAFLDVVHPRHRLMFRLLAATGLRVSELIALQWQHVTLDGSRPVVRVRRALVRGRLHPPKTKHGRRDVPLSPAVVDELRAWHKTTEWGRDEDLVFPSLAGTAHSPANVLRRFLRPAAEEVGASWAGFHTFRHTCASLLFARGANAVQVQRWLGHHSPSFTLDTYVHLLSEDGLEALDVAAETAQGGNRVATSAPFGPVSPEATISL